MRVPLPSAWRILLPALAVTAVALWPASRLLAQSTWLDEYREPAARIIGTATADTFAWNRLAELTDTIGHRLSGSPQLDHAIAWAVAEMERDGLENVHTEKVMVPRWIRGRESAELLEPARHPLAMLGLGGSVATPPEGLEAEVVVVRSFVELEARAQTLKGRMVVFNAPYTDYEDTMQYRTTGASRAARHGAIAVLVRSIAPSSLRTPHTGSVNYAGENRRIPAAAITIEDAEKLQRMQDRGSKIVVRLTMEGHYEPDAESANVVGEIVGREKPEEVVVLGAHLDSWDVGAGASDDGGGCIAVWEALRILKKLNLRPRRTLRVVLFTNEENGTRGGLAYRDAHRDELKDHVMMLESDNGVFRPLGFGFTGSDKARETIVAISRLLRGIGADMVGSEGGGADIGPSARSGRIPSLALMVDTSKYFAIHHTAADTIDKIDPTELARCAAAVSVMGYVVADMPMRLAQ